MNARLSAVEGVERRLSYRFKDRDLLERALTHASAGQGARRVADNERLEFLGDRVLGLIAADLLMRRFPEATEGELSKRLHAVVSREACARVAETLELGPALRLAAGETKRGARANATILGDACEAVIAAVYRDGGLEAARSTFAPMFELEIDRLGPTAALSPKSRLQEWAAQAKRPNPVYAVVSREGPDHAPRFTVEVRVEGFEPARASGASRQEAEKAAATALLDQAGVA
jgi:ribonuclease-3